jgi:chemotaxis protein methyltransferase CheR
MPMNHALSDADYIRFRELVYIKSGLDFSGHRRPDLERAVQSALGETATPDAASLFRLLLEEEPGRRYLDAFIARLTVGETYFFRNQPQFAALERHILPDIIARRRPVRRRRVWSAGCASGEEPYSLAILLRRLLPDLADWNVLILATDINAAALEHARRGVYGAWSFREVSPETQGAYFSRHGRELAVAPQVRAMVTFAQLNLAEDAYPSLLTNTSAMDLIVCRNVTIYFREETTRRIAGRFYDALTEGGWLVVGHAEPSQAIYHQFAVHNFPGAVVYQKGAGKHQAPEERNTAPRLSAWPAVALRSTENRQRVSHDALPSTNTPPRTGQPRPVTGHQRLAVHDGTPPDHGLRIADHRPHQEALALAEAGQPDQALRQLAALAAADPHDATAPYLAAKIAANRLQQAAAEHWIDLAVQRAPLMAPGHYLHALILHEANRLEEALAALRRCVYADPLFVLGHVALADLCARLGQPRRAQKAIETVAQLLAGRRRDELIPEGEGLTVGRILDLVAMQKDV